MDIKIDKNFDYRNTDADLEYLSKNNDEVDDDTLTITKEYINLLSEVNDDSKQ